MRAGLRHAIEVGHQVERIAVQSGTIPALLIGKENDDVGPA
jgi:hypothetical protein